MYGGGAGAYCHTYTQHTRRTFDATQSWRSVCGAYNKIDKGISYMCCDDAIYNSTTDHTVNIRSYYCARVHIQPIDGPFFFVYVCGVVYVLCSAKLFSACSHKSDSQNVYDALFLYVRYVKHKTLYDGVNPMHSQRISNF